MVQPKVLFVLTSHSKLGDTGKPTGWYLPEFAHPYEVLAPHTEITIASPAGGEAPLDPNSVEASKEDTVSIKFLKEREPLWKKTEKLEKFLGHAKEYEAIFFVGGHGPMFDLASDPISHKLINEFYTDNKIVSAVCHGPAALTHVKLSSGGYLLDGQPVTGFSNVEEDTVQMTAAMPFSLEDELNKASGGKYSKAKEPWGKHVVVGREGRLITGQNPASAGPVGQAIYDAIFGELTTSDEI
jgi:putative intracellular protease/amidase